MDGRMVIGVMTGTSLDGIDAAAVRITGSGLAMSASFVAGVSDPIGPALPALRALAAGAPISAESIAAARSAYGQALAEAAARAAADAGRVHLVALHGQTVFHRAPVSWQLVDPWPAARRLGCPVVSDLRGADLIAGGQGAPITPLADWVLFRSDAVARAIVNLGGFCNVTLLPRADDPEGVGAIEGFDVCACNHVLNMAARVGLGAEMDRDGVAAMAGTPNEDAVAALGAMLESQARRGESLGEEWMEVEPWVRDWGEARGLLARPRLAGPDLVASAAEAVGRVIGRAIRERGGAEREVVLAGGGARNRALVGSIERATGGRGRTTGDLGVPLELREAACMAVLGALAGDGECVTLRRVTGAREPIPLGGSWVNVRVNLDG